MPKLSKYRMIESVCVRIVFWKPPDVKYRLGFYSYKHLLFSAGRYSPEPCIFSRTTGEPSTIPKHHLFLEGNPWSFAINNADLRKCISGESSSIQCSRYQYQSIKMVVTYTNAFRLLLLCNYASNLDQYLPISFFEIHVS